MPARDSARSRPWVSSFSSVFPSLGVGTFRSSPSWRGAASPMRPIIEEDQSVGGVLDDGHRRGHGDRAARPVLEAALRHAEGSVVLGQRGADRAGALERARSAAAALVPRT